MAFLLRKIKTRLYLYSVMDGCGQQKKGVTMRLGMTWGRRPSGRVLPVVAGEFPVQIWVFCSEWKGGLKERFGSHGEELLQAFRPVGVEHCRSVFFRILLQSFKLAVQDFPQHSMPGALPQKGDAGGDPFFGVEL